MSNPNEPAAPPQATPAEPFEAVRERLGPQLAQAEAHLKDLNKNVKGFIQQNPGTALLGAAALGFLIGRLASRR
jgi:ElaB/YqjD/DUF883 family membrane-anchored ribosome-binding protein